MSTATIEGTTAAKGDANQPLQGEIVGSPKQPAAPIGPETSFAEKLEVAKAESEKHRQEETAATIAEHAEAIRTLRRQMAVDVVAIGEHLHAVKAELDHGEFGPWLEAEFGWSQDTANRFMRCHTVFGKIRNLRNLEFDASALYVLSATACPDDATAEAIELAKKGEHITHAKAKEIRAEHSPTVVTAWGVGTKAKAANKALVLVDKLLKTIDPLDMIVRNKIGAMCGDIVEELKNVVAAEKGQELEAT